MVGPHSSPLTRGMGYRPRVVDAELASRLGAMGAVVIEGPKACGKTETARQGAASEVLLDIDEAAQAAVQVDASLILPGDTPRLLDEWQVGGRALWNRVRREVDARKLPGQFILTGSAVPSEDVDQHTGAMRMSAMRMRPMALFESGHGSGEVSLDDVLSGTEVRSSDPGLKLPDLADRVVGGGWPGIQDLATADAALAVRDYLNQIRRVDVSRVDGRKRDPERVGRVLRSLARNTSTYASTTTITADTAGDEGTVNRDTVDDFLNVLEKLMIVEDQPAWAPHMRSRYVLRRASKRQFVDPSLAAAALRATPATLLADLKMFGFFFESLVIRDMRVYAQASDAEVLQYRDSSGLEVDAIVAAADGRWAAFEVKLGPGLIDEAAKTLLKFRDKVDTDKCGEPGALAVITGTSYGYTRADGVAVIPIGGLGP